MQVISLECVNMNYIFVNCHLKEVLCFIDEVLFFVSCSTTSSHGP